MTELGGTRALVTGATSGLGLAMARALAEAGARVAITSRDGERAGHVAAGLGPGAVGLALDVRDEVAVTTGVAEVWERLGGIDLLVNNAGIGMRTVNARFLSDPQPFWMVPPDGFRDVFETKVSGCFLMARAVAPLMLEQGGGRIVTISMSEATMVRQGFVPYGPSGAAVEALSRVMAADLADTPVTVNLLLPGGATDTGMIPDDMPAAARERLLDPAIMGPPIVWLASPAAAAVHDERGSSRRRSSEEWAGRRVKPHAREHGTGVPRAAAPGVNLQDAPGRIAQAQGERPLHTREGPWFDPTCAHWHARNPSELARREGRGCWLDVAADACHAQREERPDQSERGCSCECPGDTDGGRHDSDERVADRCDDEGAHVVERADPRDRRCGDVLLEDRRPERRPPADPDRGHERGCGDRRDGCPEREQEQRRPPEQRARDADEQRPRGACPEPDQPTRKPADPGDGQDDRPGRCAPERMFRHIGAEHSERGEGGDVEDAPVDDGFTTSATSANGPRPTPHAAQHQPMSC